MGTNASSNTRVAISLAYISDASDALAIQEVSQTILTDKIRDALKAKIVSADFLVEIIRKMSDLSNRLSRYIGTDYVVVTVQKIKGANRDEDLLAELFMGDGPKLGRKLNESQGVLDELIEAGFSINAPAFFPVLVTNFDKDGKETASIFSYMSEVERDALNALAQGDSSDHEIDIREKFIYPYEKDGPKLLVRYTCYDGSANLRPSQTDLDFAIASLTSALNELENTYANALATASKSANLLETFINANFDTKKEQTIRIREGEFQRQQQLLEVLQKLRGLRVDRDFRLKNIVARFEKNSQPNQKFLLENLTKNFTKIIQSIFSKDAVEAELFNLNINKLNEREGGYKENQLALKMIENTVFRSILTGQINNSKDKF